MTGHLQLLALFALVAAAWGKSPYKGLLGLLTRDKGVPGGTLGATECRRATADVWHLPYPDDCTKFIKCDIIGNLSTIYTCDTPLHFNTVIQTCDWPENAGCDGTIGGGESTASSTGTSSPSVTSRPGFDEVCGNTTNDEWRIPFPGDCTKFITCDRIQQRWTVFDCPSPLHFNAVKEECDWPEDAGCDGKTTSGETTASSTGTSSTSVSPLPGFPEVCGNTTDHEWHIPFPGDCTKFIKCDRIQQRWTVFDCPSPLHFNAAIQVCDWPQNAGCESPPPSSTSSSPTTPAPTTAAPTTAAPTTAAPTTPAPTTPAPTTPAPTTPAPTTAAPTTAAPTTAAPTTACTPPTTPDDCKTTTKKSCDSSSESCSCEEPVTPECTEKPSTCPEKTTSPSTSPSTPSPTPASSSVPPPEPTTTNPGGNRCPSPFGPGDVCRVATEHYWHIADPTDKTRFYKCEIASCRAFLFDCPAGLVFNQSIQVCDWP